jgi:hypothetical protein
MYEGLPEPLYVVNEAGVALMLMEKFTLRDVLSFSVKKPRKAFRYARFVLQNSLLISYVRLLSYMSSEQEGLVSVITPTYRRLDKLKEAITSVRKQDYPKWEHIIVSDGYDPEVKEYIESIEDKRIKWVFRVCCA